MTDQATDKRPGFFMIENDVIDKLDLAPHTGWLYCTIVRHINQQTGVAFPGIATLAEKSGMSKPSVITHLDKLEAIGLIYVDRQKKPDGGNAPNHYYLLSVGGVVKELNRGSQSPLPGVVKEVDHNKTKSKKTKDSSAPTGAGEGEPPKPSDNLPSWWDEGYSMVMAQALHGEKVPRRNRHISGWSDRVSHLMAQEYLVAININYAMATQTGRALAGMTDIAEKLAKLAAPPKPTKPKKKAAREKYGLEAMSVAQAEICKSIAIHYYGKVYDLLCRDERGKVMKAAANFRTPQEAEDTIAYAKYMAGLGIANGGWSTICSARNLGTYKTAAEQWRKQGSDLFLGVTSSTEELPPMDAGEGISTIGDEDGS